MLARVVKGVLLYASVVVLLIWLLYKTKHHNS